MYHIREHTTHTHTQASPPFSQIYIGDDPTFAFHSSRDIFHLRTRTTNITICLRGDKLNFEYLHTELQNDR